MKALELLYQYQHADAIAGGYMSKPIDEALKELEELKNRSCDNCKYGNFFQFDNEIQCFNIGAGTQGLYFEKDFYCSNWESK